MSDFNEGSTGVSVDLNELIERNRFLEVCLQTAQNKIVDLMLGSINTETTYKIQVENLQKVLTSNEDEN